METTTSELRLQFFQYLFGNSQGYVCIAVADKHDSRRTFKQKFYHWPSQDDQINDFIELQSTSKNIWFCVNLLEKAERRKETCLPQDIVWADLDTCDPRIVVPPPTLVIKSSPGRYQGIWKLEQAVLPEIAEDYSRRIAYKYNQNGADPSGWDLTQLLRVPFTTNMKYDSQPMVIVDPEVGDIYDASTFEAIELAPQLKAEEDSPDVPALGELTPPDKIIYKYQTYLDRSFFELYEIEPDAAADWSTRMWKLINLCYEAGMETEEVYSIAVRAKCNKYERDRRPLRFLWTEILKAKQVYDKIAAIAGDWEPLLMPELVQPEEWTQDTFIDQYAAWATKATDAVAYYHDLAGAILLSATLSGHISIETSYGEMIPNLWGLVLGESTLTRKTTAMEMIMRILQEVDPEAVMATDGSAEGMLTSLSQRSGRVSIYYRDEVSGLFEAMNRKDYLADLQQTFTKLYDGSNVKRILRREEITVTKPVFIFFGGGIRDHTYSLLSDQYILSGFLPRFLVVNGDNDLSRLRRTGPPSQEGILDRERIITRLNDLKDAYSIEAKMRIGDQVIDLSNTSKRLTKTAVLSPDAWKRYGDMEYHMAEVASESYYAPLALPTFERLSRSMLKLSVLLAASRQEPEGGSFQVDEIDVVNSARYIQNWGKYSVELIMNAGKPQILRLVEKLRVQIEKRPGVMRSELMRANHMSSREMSEVLATLVDRGEISVQRKGKREQFWTVH